MMDFRQSRDEHGRTVIGNPRVGCRYCGTVETKEAENGKAVIHHPGTMCCAAAVRDQIRYRTEELRVLRKKAADLAREMDEEGKRADTLVGREANEVRTKVARMQRSYDRQMTAWRMAADGDPENGVLGLKPELKELEAILAAMEQPTVLRAPRKDIDE